MMYKTEPLREENRSEDQSRLIDNSERKLGIDNMNEVSLDIETGGKKFIL